ncbi:hypothetical protein IAT38_001542 [Cryptococcus sp. DSM 104549]
MLSPAEPPSESDALLPREANPPNDPNQSSLDQPVHIQSFLRDVKLGKYALGACLPAVLALEACHLTMSLSEPLGATEDKGGPATAALQMQKWTDLSGVVGAILMIVAYATSFIFPCTLSRLTSPRPSFSAKHYTLVHHLRTTALIVSLFVAGSIRRGPKLYYPPSRLRTGFGLNNEKVGSDGQVAFSLTAPEDGSEDCDRSASIGRDAEKDCDSNVFDYGNSSMLSFLSLLYIAPLARRLIQVPALTQANLPLLERSSRDSGVNATVTYEKNEDGVMVRTETVTSWKLIKALWRGRGTSVLISLVLEVTRNVISFLQIAALYEVIQSFNQPAGSDKSYACLMCWAMFLGEAADVLLSAYCAVRENYMLHMPVRMAVASIVLRKILRTTDAKDMEAHNVSDEKKANAGKGRSQVMNLMTVDSGTVASMATRSWNFCNGVVTLLIGISMMYSMLGFSALVGIACVPLSMPLSYMVSRRIYRCDKEWSTARDARTGAFKEFLLGIKVIKLNAFDPYFIHRINSLRTHEVELQRWRFSLGTIFNILADQLPVLAVLITFAFHTKVQGKTLDAPTAFVSLTFFNRIKDGLQAFPKFIQDFLNRKVSLERICRYLSQPEINFGHYENASRAITCSSATTGWPASEHETGGETQSFKLADVNLDVPEGELTLLCGPLGSGKTLLLRALLGEANVETGTVLAPRSLPDATPFFERTPQGRLLNVFGSDMWRLDSNSADDFGRMLKDGLTLVTAAGVVFLKEPVVALVAVGFGIPLFWISGHLNKLRSDIRRLTAIASSPLYSLYNETIGGVVMMRAFGQGDLIMGTMRALINRERTACLADWAVYNWVRTIIRSVTSILIAATGFVLVGREMSPGEAGLILSFSLTVSGGLFNLMERYSSLEQTFVSAERVNHYITLPEHESEEGSIPDQLWPSRDVSFKIEAETRVGLVGATGSGKSTLALSLFRAINHMDGQLIIDDLDISTIALPELRRRLNMVAQDGILCSGTLREALDVTGTKDDFEIYEALRREHLLSDNVTDEELENSPFANLNTYVAIEGGNFSQGQRQLLCLARALLKDSKILVMEEATSSVDFEMDSKITSTIKECFAGTTMLVIAHRLATIMYDKVMVLDQGRIIETGVPSQLMEEEQSHFHALCMAQGKEEFDNLMALART